MKNLIKVLAVISLITSCQTEENFINPYFAENYPLVLAEIDIECIESNEQYYISANINNQEFCHDQEKVGEFSFAVTNKFSTASPSFSTNQEENNARKGLRLSLGSPDEQFQEYFILHFPDFNLERNVHDYLDSLTELTNHDLIGSEDIIIPEDASPEEEVMLEIGSGWLNHFKLELRSTDLINDPNGNISGGGQFVISTVFGTQENSFLRINEFERKSEFDGIYYYMDISFECDLHHWPQYGYEGIWANIRDGRITLKTKIQE